MRPPGPGGLRPGRLSPPSPGRKLRFRFVFAPFRWSAPHRPERKPSHTKAMCFSLHSGLFKVEGYARQAFSMVTSRGSTCDSLISPRPIPESISAGRYGFPAAGKCSKPSPMATKTARCVELKVAKRRRVFTVPVLCTGHRAGDQGKSLPSS